MSETLLFEFEIRGVTGDMSPFEKRGTGICELVARLYFAGATNFYSKSYVQKFSHTAIIFPFIDHAASSGCF